MPSPGTDNLSGRSLQLIDATLLLECTVTPLKELGTEIEHSPVVQSGPT